MKNNTMDNKQMEDLLKSIGISKKKSFQEMMAVIDRVHIEEIFEEGFKIGAFNRDRNRNVIRWQWKGKTYEIQRFET